MSTTLRDSRALIATIRHDIRAGNIERARKWCAELCVGYWGRATPAELEHACTEVETMLDDAGVR